VNIRKLILILNILSIFILTGCENTNNINYNSDIKVKGPSLKISLIQTAYEIYNVNIENSNNNSTYKDLYENTSNYAKKHYKWLVKTYNSMDDNMKLKLKNIFDSNSSWLYINSVINLNDNANVDNIINTLIVSGVILGISLIEILLMIRSSFLTRIKEVGIYRAIGVKKSDIYKMFVGEIFAITIIASFTGISFMTYILYNLSKINYLNSMFMVNIPIYLISLLLILLFNLIVGLLPVFNTIRKTPAQILSRFDVD